jgi:hypothetical protein
MGTWRVDQSKNAKRYVWQQTRGEQDEMLRDFVVRFKAYPVFAEVKLEKIGSEIHVWRPIKESSGKSYWASCMRFKDDGWGYWDVFYRPDERRWRTTTIKETPLTKAISAAADWYEGHIA